MTKHVLSHPAAAGDGVDCDINGVERTESWWRSSHLVVQMARPLAELHLTQLIGRVRPFAVEVAHALDSSDTATLIAALF
jgi:hypothetical protein